MKSHRIAILFCLGFSSFFHLVRAEEPSVMLTFNGLRFGCFPVVDVPYTAEETTSELRTGNWWEVRRRVFVARDSQGRTVRRERIEHRVVNGVAESSDTTVTINDPSAHTFARWVEGETSITVIDFQLTDPVAIAR